MSQLNFHSNSPLNPPPRQSPAIITKLVATYKVWQEYLPHLPKQAKYSLGLKIDGILIEIIGGAITACYVEKTEKLPYITKTIVKLDTLKFFLKIAWETKVLDNKKYVAISEPLDEIGRMLGGWRNQNLKQTSAQDERKK